MIVPGVGISSIIPSNYKEIIRRLKALGISPTGNIEIDKSNLKKEIERRIEVSEERKKLESEKPGQENQALLNRLFHKI